MAYGDNYALKEPSSLGVRSKRLLNRRLYNLMRQDCRAGPLKLLEVGAGHGFFAEICTELGNEFFAIEPNKIMYDGLVSKNYSVKQVYCPPIPHQSEEFDLVYAGYVLEYLQDAKTAFTFVEECHRVLRPGGVLAIVSSDYMKMGKEFWNVAYMTSFATTERRIRQLLFDAGFEHTRSVFFAGNLFGATRYFAYVFYKFYSYNLFNAIFRQKTPLDSRFYKLRVTFPEGVLITGKK